MPLTVTELLIGMAIMIGVPIMIYFLEKMRRGLGLIFLVALIILMVIGNLIEKAVS